MTAKLGFTSPQTTTGATTELQVEVNNQGAAATGNDLIIQLAMPRAALAPEVQNTFDDAANADELRAFIKDVMVSGGTGTWNAWAYAAGDAEDKVVKIWLMSMLDSAGQKADDPGAIPAGGTLKVTLPLSIPSDSTSIEVIPSYGVFRGNYQLRGPDVTTEPSLFVTVLPQDVGMKVSPVEVSLTTDHPANPTALEMGTPVTLTWSVNNGLSGWLSGPQLGGTVSLDLNPNGPKTGQVTVMALGPAFYLLDVTVKGTDVNIRVQRQVVMDVDYGKWGKVYVTPDPLPVGGCLDVHYAFYSDNVTATVDWVGDGNKSGLLPGCGVIPFSFPQSQESATDGQVKLTLDQGASQAQNSASYSFSIVQWANVLWKPDSVIPKSMLRDFAITSDSTTGKTYLATCEEDRILFWEASVANPAGPQEFVLSGPFWSVVGLEHGFAVLVGGAAPKLVHLEIDRQWSTKSSVDLSSTNLAQDDLSRTLICALGNTVFLLPYKSSIAPPLSVNFDSAVPAPVTEPFLTPTYRGGLCRALQALADGNLYGLFDGGNMLRWSPVMPKSGYHCDRPKVCKQLSTACNTLARVRGVLVAFDDTNSEIENQAYDPHTDSWKKCGIPMKSGKIVSQEGEQSYLWRMDDNSLSYLDVAKSERLFVPTYNQDIPVAQLAAVDDRYLGLAQCLSGADFRNMDLRNLPLAGCCLDQASLDNADLRGCSLKGCSFKSANLKGANLGDVDLDGCNLAYANLSNADLAGANLRGSNLVGTNLQGAKIEDAKKPPDTLNVNEALCWNNDTLLSNDGTRLIYKGDCNLVLYDAEGSQVWESRTGGRFWNKAILDSDLNFNIYWSPQYPVDPRLIFSTETGPTIDKMERTKEIPGKGPVPYAIDGSFSCYCKIADGEFQVVATWLESTWVEGMRGKAECGWSIWSSKDHPPSTT